MHCGRECVTACVTDNYVNLMKTSLGNLAIRSQGQELLCLKTNHGGKHNRSLLFYNYCYYYSKLFLLFSNTIDYCFIAVLAFYCVIVLEFLKLYYILCFFQKVRVCYVIRSYNFVLFPIQQSNNNYSGLSPYPLFILLT